jgi:DNA-binding NtrC family response regulator
VSEAVLIIDDDLDFCSSLARALVAAKLGYDVACANSAKDGLEIIEKHPPLAVILDLSLETKVGPEGGLSALSKILALDPSLRVIVLTGEDSKVWGIQSLSKGAANFLQKPPDILHLKELVKDAVNQTQLVREHYQLLTGAKQESRIIGTGKITGDIRRQVFQAAQTRLPVFISGETGTGKSLVAHELHRLSPRAARKFISYQPLSQGGDLVLSDLFGHMKGAFTGAAEMRRGLITEAAGGTLFLDELAEFPSVVQVALLRFLQDRVYRPLGGNSELTSDVRIICATNADLEEALKSGKLREDLYHRISHITLRLPPLRERLEDIPSIVDARLAELRAREESSVIGCEPDALDKLQKHSWPGNVRELEALIDFAAYRASFENLRYIKLEHINFKQSSQNLSQEQEIAALDKLPNEGSLSEALDTIKLTLIKNALTKHNGNQTSAAKELKIDRTSLRRALKRAGET